MASVIVGYSVILTGGSLAEQAKREGKFFLDHAEAKSYAVRMRKLLSPGEKKYYKLNYKVVPVKG